MVSPGRSPLVMPLWQTVVWQIWTGDIEAGVKNVNLEAQELFVVWRPLPLKWGLLLLDHGHTSTWSGISRAYDTAKILQTRWNCSACWIRSRFHDSKAVWFQPINQNIIYQYSKTKQNKNTVSWQLSATPRSPAELSHTILRPQLSFSSFYHWSLQNRQTVGVRFLAFWPAMFK